MHKSYAISVLNCALDKPCFFYIRVLIFLKKSENSKAQAANPSMCVFKLLFLSSRPPQTMGDILEISIARRQCLRVSGKVVLWSIHFDIRILVPMSYSELWKYIYLPSRRQREATGDHWRQQRPVPAHRFHRFPKFSPLPTLRGPLKLRSLGE